VWRKVGKNENKFLKFFKDNFAATLNLIGEMNFSVFKWTFENDEIVVSCEKIYDIDDAEIFIEEWQQWLEIMGEYIQGMEEDLSSLKIDIDNLNFEDVVIKFNGKIIEKDTLKNLSTKE